jgi:MFS family permease
MIYSDGVRDKTESLGQSLSQRLRAPLSLGLDLANFGGLEKVFTEYKVLYPELSYVALTDGRNTVISTDKSQIGQPWRDFPNTYAYTVPIGGASNQQRLVRVGIPQSIIYDKLFRGIKNFAVLFVSCGFVALLFFNLLQALTSRIWIGKPGGPTWEEYQTGIVAPLYFLAVFVEALAASFLPLYLQGLAKAGSFDPGQVPTLFTIYFVAYGLSLLPASRFAERHGTRGVLLAGAAMTVLVGLGMALVTNFLLMYALRALAGVAQGLVLAGIQTFVLEVTSARRTTQGAGILVSSYNSAMIAGTALGALLSVYIAPQGVFVLATALSLLIVGYVARLVPQTGRRKRARQPVEETDARDLAGSAFGRAENDVGLWRGMAAALSDLGFLKTIVLIGIPAKAVLAGITIFALPLILAHQNYQQEDIGQVIMFYAAGVLLSSAFVVKMVDRIGRTRLVLFIGTMMSAVGLALIGLVGWDPIVHSDLPFLGPLVVVSGMSILGISHGFITAPVVTHVAQTDAATTLGKSSTASLYRFLERLGHMTGPLIVSTLLLWNNQDPLTISALGGAFALFGLLFILGRSSHRSGLEPAEAAPMTMLLASEPG